MTPQAAPDYFELSEYLSVPRRRWRIIVAAALAGLVLAVAYVELAPKVYTATVLVQVNALPNNANAVGGRTGGPVNMDNEAQSVKSGAVAAIARSRMHSPLSLTAIEQQIHVAVPPNSTFLQITVGAPTAVGARDWASAIGGAYLYYRATSTRTLIGDGIAALKAQEDHLRATIERLKVLLFLSRHKKGSPSGSPVLVDDALQLGNAQVALLAAQEHIDSAMPLYASLSAPGGVIVGQVVTAPTLPLAPSSPRKLLVLPSGLVAGLVLGLALAFIVDLRGKRRHSAAAQPASAGPAGDPADVTETVAAGAGNGRAADGLDIIMRRSYQPEPEPAPPAAGTAARHQAPEGLPEFTSSPVTGRAGETWPAARAGGTERGSHSRLVDPAGD